MKSQSPLFIGTREIGDLGSNASAPPLIWQIPIILYTRKVVNAKSDVLSLGTVTLAFDNEPFCESIQ